MKCANKVNYKIKIYSRKSHVGTMHAGIILGIQDKCMKKIQITEVQMSYYGGHAENCVQSLLTFQKSISYVDSYRQ